jgi:Domain of unknown function (DUF1910)./Domain of unknown function (DUF1911).
MRDILKNETYFNDFITRTKARSEKYFEMRNKIAGIRGENDGEVKSLNYNIFKFSLHTVIASYSVGKSIDEMRNLFLKTFDLFLQVEKSAYSDFVQISSLCTLFEMKEYLSLTAEKASSSGLVDKFLLFMLRNPALVISHNGFPEYDKIANIMDAADKSTVIKDYLSSWYSENKDSYWHDMHKNKFDVYFGYWSFESAAAVKILNFNPLDFYENRYFPRDFFN